MPSNGLALALLKSQIECFKTAAPQYKISPVGGLGYALEQASPSIVSQAIDDGSGYIRDVNIRYLVRGAAGSSTTVDDCSLQTEAAYLTQTMPSLMKRYMGIWFDIKTIQQFTADALAPRQVGTPPTKVMEEVVSVIRSKINGLLQDINIDLLGSVVFGKNVSTASNATKSVNFPQAASTFLLNTAMNEVSYDIRNNEAKFEECSIIGSGNIVKAYQALGANGVAANGLNQSQLIWPKLYFDPYAATAFGANQFAVVEKNAIQFLNVSYNRLNSISGRFGNSTFGTITFPIQDSEGNILRTLEFDWQAIEVDCPTDQTIDEYGFAMPKGRGIKFIIGCHYAFLQLPSTAYSTSDRLTQVNGVWRFTGTNT